MKCGPVSATRFAVSPAKALGAVFDPTFEYRITDPTTNRHAERIAEGFEVICEVATTDGQPLVVIGRQIPKETP